MEDREESEECSTVELGHHHRSVCTNVAARDRVQGWEPRYSPAQLAGSVLGEVTDSEAVKFAPPLNTLQVIYHQMPRYPPLSCFNHKTIS